MSAVMDQVLIGPGLPADVTGTVMICSIYPDEKRHELALAPGFRKFTLPAAERGKYTLLPIRGGYRFLRDLTNVNEESPTPGMSPIWQDPYTVAESLVDYWTLDTVGGDGRPGIAVMPRGMTEPTKEFLVMLEEQQTLYFRNLVTAASAMERKGDHKNINELHRTAASWLYGTGADKLPWYPKANFREVKKCLGCAQEILTDAIRCEHCSLDLVDFYMKYKLDPSDDHAVARMLARITNPAPKEAPPVFAAEPPKDPRPLGERPLSSLSAKERQELINQRLDTPKK